MPDTTGQYQPQSRFMRDEAAGIGERALEQASEMGAVARDTVKENPIATLAVIAGAAFAIGALWKIGHARPQSTGDALMARLSDLQAQLPRKWRA